MTQFTAEKKEDRKQYAFLLVINKKVVGTIISEWWQTENEMKMGAGYAALTARRFKKSAGVLVYERGATPDCLDCWHLCHSCEVSQLPMNAAEFYPAYGLPDWYEAAM